MVYYEWIDKKVEAEKAKNKEELEKWIKTELEAWCFADPKPFIEAMKFFIENGKSVEDCQALLSGMYEAVCDEKAGEERELMEQQD
jgi:hypothetical protein